VRHPDVGSATAAPKDRFDVRASVGDDRRHDHLTDRAGHAMVNGALAPAARRSGQGRPVLGRPGFGPLRPVLVALVAVTSLTVASCSSEPSPTTATTAVRAGDVVPAAEADLVQAVGDRLVLAVAVAESKWSSGAPVEDRDREAQALLAIEAAATTAGVDPAEAVAALAAQIEASKVVQWSLHEQWADEQRPPFTETVDLVADLRPRLDAATQAMLDALAAGGAPLSADGLVEHESQVAARLEGVPAAADAARTALRPFAPAPGR
jgi:chorismate mutase